MGSQSFSDMSAEAQTALVTKLGALLEECGLGEVSVDVTRETVCPLAADAVEDKFELSVQGKLPMVKKEGVDKFNAAYKSVMEGVDESSYKICVAACPGAGDPYTTIEKVARMEDGEETNLEHVKGQVWLLDFWATWCPPCQGPMAENQAMLEKNTDWEGKAEIVGMSIDNDTSTVTNHCNAKGWTKPRMLHVRNGKCHADKLFSFRGI